MHDKKIISKHKKIIDILKKHNENYFIYDNPKISDREYDEIKLEALTLEKKYQYLKITLFILETSKTLINLSRLFHLTFQI